VFSQRHYMWIDSDMKVRQELRESLQHMAINIRDGTKIISGSDTNCLILSIPNIDINGNTYQDSNDTVIYSIDPGDSTRMLMEVRQTPWSTHNRWGWGAKLLTTGVSNALWVETRTMWFVIGKLVNSDDHFNPPLFAYSETPPLLPDNDANCVTVTFRLRYQSTPGKYQLGTLQTLIRLRNKF